MVSEMPSTTRNLILCALEASSSLPTPLTSHAVRISIRSSLTFLQNPIFFAKYHNVQPTSQPPTCRHFLAKTFLEVSFHVFLFLRFSCTTSHFSSAFTSDISCAPGQFLTFGATSNLGCQSCPAGTYSVGGGTRISSSDWDNTTLWENFGPAGSDISFRSWCVDINNRDSQLAASVCPGCVCCRVYSAVD